MAVREYYGLVGSLVENIDASTILIPVSPNISGALAASGFVNGTDSTYLAIYTGNVYELVKVTAVNGNILTVVRHQGSTSAAVFPIGSTVAFQITSAGLLEQLAPIVNDVTIVGEGMINIESPEPNAFIIQVPGVPFIQGTQGIEVTGEWPNITISYTPPEGDCCGEGGGGGGSGTGITDVVGQGMVDAYVDGSTAYVYAPTPFFNAGTGISITGEWPNLTISATGGGGGGVSIVSVGAGLTLTGSPTSNPTISITATGVVPGDYSGVGINARGQITGVPVGFAPISEIVPGDGLSAVRTGGSVTLTPDVAAIGVPGVAPLADPDDDFDPNDDTSIATPAVVAKALETLVVSDVTGASSYTGEVTSDYSNIIGATSTPILLLPGDSALVYAEVTVVDGTTPLTPVAFGLAVFDGAATMLKGNRKITQSSQSMSFIIEGPINTSLTAVTTALPAGATMQSYSLSITKF